jgi:hypothetical protein
MSTEAAPRLILDEDPAPSRFSTNEYDVADTNSRVAVIVTVVASPRDHSIRSRKALDWLPDSGELIQNVTPSNYQAPGVREAPTISPVTSKPASRMEKPAEGANGNDTLPVPQKTREWTG